MNTKNRFSNPAEACVQQEDDAPKPRTLNDAFEEMAKSWGVRPGTQRHRDLKVAFFMGAVNASSLAGRVDEVNVIRYIELSNMGRTEEALRMLTNVTKE